MVLVPKLQLRGTKYIIVAHLTNCGLISGPMDGFHEALGDWAQGWSVRLRT